MVGILLEAGLLIGVAARVAALLAIVLVGVAHAAEMLCLVHQLPVLVKDGLGPTLSQRLSAAWKDRLWRLLPERFLATHVLR